eukprot:scaffold108287_cov66-Phaeocystis_antarctica.AAC.1
MPYTPWRFALPPDKHSAHCCVIQKYLPVAPFISGPEYTSQDPIGRTGTAGGGGGGGDGGGTGGDGGGADGGALGGTIPANWASSSRLMPLAVRKSAARSSPEHVSFLSPTPTHLNGSTPSTLVLNEMAVWRPEMRSSFAVFGSGGNSGGGA